MLKPHQQNSSHMRLPRRPSTVLHDYQVNLNTSCDEIIWNKNASKKLHQKCPLKIDIAEVFHAAKLFSKTNGDIMVNTDSPLQWNKLLSEEYDAEVYLKREEQQRGHSYKIRGAYYYYLSASQEEKNKGIVVVSDGNFASAVAIIAGFYKMKTIIYVPQLCYQHKIDFMRQKGGQYVQIFQVGKDFFESWKVAQEFSQKQGMVLLQPHSNERLMVGYATIANEIIGKKETAFDYILVPSGGGALVSSLASFFKQIAPQTKVIAVEPDTCKPFSQSIVQNKLVQSQKFSTFCNGSSVRSIGESCFEIGKSSVDGFVTVSENKVAERMVRLYSMGIISEPSGALGITGLDKVRNLIKGKKVLCLLSGANMDLARYDEAREMNSKAKGYKNFFMLNLSNKRAAVYDLIVKCFKKTDVITIQYSRNLNKNATRTLIAVESLTQDDVEQYIRKLNQEGIQYENVTEREEIISLFF